jgi:filamentous hemagglutinin family protein
MNKIYRLVWNEFTGTWIAVAENVKACGKRASGVVLVGASILAAPALALAAPASNALPTGGQVVAGQAAISQSGATMTINQSSQRTAIDWQSFDIGSQAQVNFVQPGASAVALNRVVDGNPSQIFGHLTANGQVFLSNPSGVYFAPSASVNVGGLVATTHSISLDDFMAGKAKFVRNGSTGSVINEGELKAALGGYIALLAPEVRNQGVILANLGTVALGAGETCELQFDSNNTLAGLRVSASTVKALVDNRSAVLAPGGLIILSAQAVDRVQGGVIKNSGTIEATGIQQRAGRIVLDASTAIENTGRIAANAGADGPAGSVSLSAPEIVNTGSIEAKGNAGSPSGGSIQIAAGNFTHAGTLDVSAPKQGGDIAIRASSQVELSGRINASASGDTSQGGEISIQAAQITTTDAVLDASGGQGGNIILDASAPAQDTPSSPRPAPEPGKVALTGSTQLNSRGRRGKGGAITLLGDDLALNDSSALNASGTTGGGTVLVGGDWQGSNNVYQATTVTMAANASIDASATQQGDGGKVVLWSDVHNESSQTLMGGSILAKGAGGGQGGQVETSAYHLGVSGNVNAGMGGSWLLDPIDLTITSSGSYSVPGTGGTSAPTTNNVTVLNTSINTALDNGNNVTLQTSGGTGGSGNITVAANITKSGGAASSLTLQADAAIVVNAGVSISDTSSGNALSLNLQATGPIRFADNASATNSVNIHGALYMGGKAGGTTYATGNATYVDGIYVGNNTVLTAGGITALGQGAAGATGEVGGSGIKLASGASLSSATGAIVATGIGGKGGGGTVGTAGYTSGDGGATNGGTGAVGTVGGDGINLANTAAITGTTVALTGTGGDGGAGGAGGAGGNATNSYGYGGGAGGAGGAGATGGSGIVVGATTISATTGIAITGTGGKGGTGGDGGHGGNASNNTSSTNGSGSGGNGGAGGTGGTSGNGFVLGSGATVAASTGTIAIVSATGAAGTGGSGGGGGNAGSVKCGFAWLSTCWGNNGGTGSTGSSGSSAFAFNAAGAGYIGAASGGSSSADITFINDSMSLGSLTIQSTGALTIQTKTASTLIDLGTYTTNTAHLQLAQSAFWNGTAGNFKDGFSSITVGSATQTGAIAVSGLTYADALTLNAGGTGGTVTVSGAVTDAGSGTLSGALTMNAGGAVTIGGNVTTHNQGVNITGASYTQNNFDLVAGSGDISITADSAAFNTNTGSNPLQTTGALTLRPKSLSTALTLASANAYNGGTGLDLNATEISYLKNSGASSITIGRSDSTGVMTFAAAVDLAGKTINLSAGSMTDGTTTNRIVTASNLNLLANGAIGGSGNNAIDFVASTVSANTTGNASAYLTSTTGYAVGTSNVGSGTLSLATTGTGGSVTQSGAVTAGTLTSSLAGTNSQLNLATQNNAIGNLAGITAGGGFSLTNGNTATTVSANITTSTGNGAVSIDTGTYTQNANIDIASGSGAIMVTADNMVINTNTGNNAFATTGALTLQTSTATRGITLGGTTEIAGQLTLQNSEFTAFSSNTPSSITIGRADGTGVMTMASTVAVASPILNLKAGSIAATVGVGNATVNGGAGTLNLYANQSGGDIGSSASALGFSAATVTVHTTGNGSAYLSNLSNFALGASDLGSGTLSLQSTNVTQSGALTAGALKLQSSGNVILDNASNSIASVSGTTVDLTLADTQGIEVGTTTITGNLGITTSGNVTSAGALKVSGTTTLDTGTHDVTLNYAGSYFDGVVSATAHDLTLRNTHALVLGASTLDGNLNLNTGSVSQTAGLTVAGTTTIAAASSDVILSNTANDFGGAVSVTGATVAITDKNDLHLGSSTTGGTFTAIAGAGGGTPTTGDLYLDSGATITSGNNFTSSGTANSVVLVVGDGTSRFVNNAGANAIKLTYGNTPTDSRWLIYTNDPYSNNDVLGGLKSYNEAVYGTHYTGYTSVNGSTDAAPDAITQTGNRYVLKVQASAIPGYDPNKVTITVLDLDKTYGDAVTLTTADNTSIVYASGTMSFAEFSEAKPTWLDVSALTLNSGGASGSAHVGNYEITASGSLGVNGASQSLPTLSLGGTASWSYSDGTHYVNLSDTSQIMVTPRTLSLTVSGGAVADKIYDGTTTASFATAPSFNLGNLVNGDTVNLTGSSDAQFEDKNVGSNKLVTLSGLAVDNTDYVLSANLPTFTASITPRSITVAATGTNKIYDASDAASATLAASSSATAGTAGSGYILGDRLGYTYTNAVFDAGKNAGDNKAVTVNGIVLDGLDANNYTLTSTTATTTANIAKRSLTLSSLTGSKEYDGNTNLAAATVVVDTVNVVGADVVTGASGAATFDTRDAGTGKTLTADLAALALTGTDAGNYTLGTGNYVGSGDITPKAVTVTAGNITKTYDGTTAYTSNMIDVAALSSQLGVAGDSISAATISYADRHAGTGNKTVTLDSVTVADGNGGNNYTITLVGNTTSTIDKAAVTVSTANVIKTYDGTTAATGSGTVVSGQLFGGDTLDASGLTYSFTDKNVANNKRIIVGGSATISDGNNGNDYNVTLTDNYTSTITRLNSVTWVGGSSGNWFDPANWAGGAVPDLSNVANVVIPSGTTVNFGSTIVAPAENGPVNIDSLNGSGGNLSQNAGTLNVGAGGITLGTLTQSGGILTNAGTTTLDSFNQSGGSFSGTGSMTTGQFSQTGGTTTLADELTVTQDFSQGSTGSISVGGNTQITDTSGGMQVGNLSTSGNVTAASTDGAITQASGTAIVADGTSSFTASQGGNPATIDLGNAANDFVGPMSASGSNITLTDGQGGLILGDVTATGNLVASSTDGALTQVSGTTIIVDGTSSFTATQGGNPATIDLSNAGNDFVGPVSVSGSNIALTDGHGGLILGDVTATGNLTANSTDGAITQVSGTSIVAGGTSSFTASQGGNPATIDLSNAGNDFVGPVSASGSNIALTDGQGGLILGDVTATGNLGATSTDGTLTQASGTAIVADGTSSFTATQGGNPSTIDLSNAGNDFVGPVSASGSNITLTDGQGGLILGNVTATGNLGATSAGGNLTQSLGSSIRVTGDGTFAAPGSQVQLIQAGNSFGGKLTVSGSIEQNSSPVLPPPSAPFVLPTPDSAPPDLHEVTTRVNSPANVMSNEIPAAEQGHGSNGIVNALSVQLEQIPSEQNDGLITVLVPKKMMEAGFVFTLPEQVKEEKTEDSSITVMQADGAALPEWLTFVPELMRFKAKTIPPEGLPLKVVITISGHRTIIVVAAASDGRQL